MDSTQPLNSSSAAGSVSSNRVSTDIDGQSNAGSLKKRVVIGVVAAIMVSLAGHFLYEHLTYVTTDNATVQARTALLSAKVSGIVTQVNIEENQKVKAGMVLVKIDGRDYQNTLSQVESEMGSVQAHLVDAEKNFRRMARLVKENAVSQQQADTAEATFRENTQKLNSLKAQVEQARLNLSYTEIKAPTDGIVAKKSAEVGMLAATGQPLVGFVEAKERWIVANFKETEIKSIALGKPVEVSVDAIPGKNYEGVVESISPSTGATFTLLPPDNATGNFTKVVQRVPVRIRLVNLSEGDLDRLQAGLSAEVKVKIR